MQKVHTENHLIERTGWLRAAVLGANDGIISTASLILGVVSAGGGRHEALVAGVAGLVAGAMAMAAGEYVSVSSQADTEDAALAKERHELATDHASELAELAHIYEQRGVDAALAQEVARQLMAHDALGAHARDELGLSEHTSANPIQAALASALTFSAGAAVPLILAVVISLPRLMPGIGLGALLCLAVLGAIGAKAGGAPVLKPALRVTFWGILAMAATVGIGKLFGTLA
ncbi:VIT1/CCC1 transporter family protein [Acidocella facilis]|uniref:VIT1/CCC1 transporter family protein n=1 Tax=Acidocella facilis TaxID=525 RepID=UPI00047C6060|nr:VIT family protein [Acidocella facilis]